MQGINWGSKELKKTFVSHRLEEMNQNSIKLLEIAAIIYATIIIEAYFNGKTLKFALYLTGLLVSLYIMKVMIIIGEKAKKRKSEKQFSLSELI